MTIGELRNEILKPGNIYGDISSANDTFRVQLVKADLLKMVAPAGATQEGPAAFEILTDDDGLRFLCSF